MSVKVLVRVDREGALKAIQALDDFSALMTGSDTPLPKKLKRKYRDARAELMQAIHHFASCNGVSDILAAD